MNIIFDLGGVTLTWSEDLLLEHNFGDSKFKYSVYYDMFKSDLWKQLDKGTMTKEEIINSFSENKNFSYEVVKKLIDSIPDILHPIYETINIIKDLKSNGHRLYVLSNMGIDIAAEVEKKYNFWELFDGTIFSGRIKMVKPDNEIFFHILEKYNLDVNKTVFIDDTLNNIIAAKKLGFTTIHFKSPAQCEEELINLKCL